MGALALELVLELWLEQALGLNLVLTLSLELVPGMAVTLGLMLELALERPLPWHLALALNWL